MLIKTETPTEPACLESLEIKDVLRELAAIREDVVAAPAVLSTRLDGVDSPITERAPVTSCITSPSVATTSAGCKSGWPRWDFLPSVGRSHTCWLRSTPFWRS